MKQRLLFWLLTVIIGLPAFGQPKSAPVFYIKNRATTNSDSVQVHALWRGMKNPFIITCNDSKVHYDVRATGGKVLNKTHDHQFDLVPHQREVALYMVGPNKDTLETIHLLSRELIRPSVELVSVKGTVESNQRIHIKEIADLSINIHADPVLTRDLIEIPEYIPGKIEIVLSRGRKVVAKVEGLDKLKSIERKAKPGDNLAIMMISYSFQNGMDITMEDHRMSYFRLSLM